MSSRPPQPPEMQVIERRRRTSIRQAAAAAGMSETRWRQLARGYRDTKIGPAPERAPDWTVARMAYAVGATPQELRGAGRGKAAEQLEAYAAAAEEDEQQVTQAADAAVRAAASEYDLSARQRADLAAMIADDLRAIRGAGDGALPPPRRGSGGFRHQRPQKFRPAVNQEEG